MTSKERIRATVNREPVDIIATNFECVPSMMEKLKSYFGFTEDEEVFEKFGADIRQIFPDYIGPKVSDYFDDKNQRVATGPWGERYIVYKDKEAETYIPAYFPMDYCETIDDLKNYPWPKLEYFDLDGIKNKCLKHKDKAVEIGCWGPFQWATHLRSMDKILIDMVLDPEFAHYFFDRIVEFELEYYEKLFIAGDGQIDLLKICDDYGTQAGLLFSKDMWKEYFEENTKKLVNLAHKYGALLHQHSCGAISEIIPYLIDCGIDILEPLQKVKGMEPIDLKMKYGDKLTFLGGIDTQTVLPFGTVEEVKKETQFYIDVLNKNGGYILMASQSFETDVPIENIIEMYSLRQ